MENRGEAWVVFAGVILVLAGIMKVFDAVDGRAGWSRWDRILRRYRRDQLDRQADQVLLG